jgi:YfiH family protein
MTLPAVPDPFYWTSSPCGLVLRCRPLEAVAPHVFTTRELPLSSSDDWHRVAEAVSADQVAMVQQVHGREVVAITSETAPAPERAKADALVSDHPSVAVAVRAADCVPLLLADARTGAVAAVHAGWRGTAAGVATAAVDTMRCRFGARPGDLVVAIGPSIGACCYEVGQDVRDAFGAAGHGSSIDRWFAGKRLDLVAANRDQLTLAGVRAAEIHACGLCTAMHLDVLTSYRAEKEKAGRIVAAIRAPRYNPAL